MLAFSTLLFRDIKMQHNYLRPKHGGRLNDACAAYNIKLESWLDLSTGVNPNGWPVPVIPEAVFRDLPDNDDLLSIAAEYYGSSYLQVTSGSQQSIELLPKILGENLTIGIVSPTYAEHVYTWKKNGHHVLLLQPEEISLHLHKLDCLVIVNPNNPSGYFFPAEELLSFQQYFLDKQKYSNKTAYLIVDEAFIDSTSEFSIISSVHKGHLIILRSIGKFFGLAGIRCGFIFSQPELLKKISLELMPWSVNHPARWIVRQVLIDQAWIVQNIKYLNRTSQQLSAVLSQFFGQENSTNGCSLFRTVYCKNAHMIYESLARQGILVRLLDNEQGLRFGLPGSSEQFNSLATALAAMK